MSSLITEMENKIPQMVPNNHAIATSKVTSVLVTLLSPFAPSWPQPQSPHRLLCATPRTASYQSLGQPGSERIHPSAGAWAPSSNGEDT